jgi:hypothetical protein
MRWFLERVTQPDIEPLDLESMKRHLHEFISVTTRDDDITGLIQGAREWAEDATGRALIDQQWRLTITDNPALVDAVQEPSCPCGVYTPRPSEILLRRSPVLSIVSFVTVDSEGDETAVDSDTYELRLANSKWPRIVALNGATWNTGTYRIVFRAGYADRDVSPPEDASEVPFRFKQAMKLWAQATYEPDEHSQEVLDVAERLIESERCGLGLA